MIARKNAQHGTGASNNIMDAGAYTKMPLTTVSNKTSFIGNSKDLL